MACLRQQGPKVLQKKIATSDERLPAEARRRGPKGTDGDRPQEPVGINTQTFEIRAPPQTGIEVEETQSGLLRAGDLDALVAGGHELVAEKKLRLYRPEAEFGQSGRESISPPGRDGSHAEKAFRDKLAIGDSRL